MKWQEIEQSARYENATEEQKVNAKNIYFDKYAMPKFQEAGIDTDTARQEFFKRTSPVQEATPEQQQAIDKDQQWIHSFADQQWVDNTKAKGEIGIYESFQKLNKWEMLPFLNAKTIGDDISILHKMGKIKQGTANAEDQQQVNEYLKDMAEVQLRGYSTGGQIVDAGLRLPAYATEFAVTFGAGAVAKTGAKIAVKKSIKTAVKTGTKKLAKVGVKTATMTGHRVAKKYLENNISETVAITDKGQAIFTEAETAPATAITKAYADVLIENLSEMAGATVLKPIANLAGKGVNKLAPEVVKKIFNGISKTTVGKGIASVVKAKDKVGFNGIIEELGEERLGDIMRFAVDIDKEEDYSFEQLQQAINPGAEQWTVELGLTSIFGGVSIATNKLNNSLRKKKVPDTEIKEIINNSSETEREMLNDQIEQEEKIEAERPLLDSEQVKLAIEKNEEIPLMDKKDIDISQVNLESLQDNAFYLDKVDTLISESNLTEEKYTQEQLINAVDTVDGAKKVINEAKEENLIKQALEQIEQIEQTIDVEKARELKKITRYKEMLSRKRKADITDQDMVNRVINDINFQNLDIDIQKEIRTTKPAFSVGISKGKYDYNTNKYFEAIRKFNTAKPKVITDAQAQIAANETEDKTELENMIERFTNYKFLGKNATIDLQEKVLADIRKVKAYGKKAADAKDLQELINRNKDVAEVIDLVLSGKFDSKKLKTKTANAITSTVGNFEMFMTMLGGKKLRDKFTVIENQMNEFNAVARESDKVVNTIAEVMKVEKSKALNVLQDMNSDSFEVVRKDQFGKPEQVSVMGAIDVYNAIKNETIREDFYRVYGQEQIDNLVSQLTNEQRKIGDSFNETVQGYHDKINKVFIELYNRDLPTVNNYWMSTAEHQSTKDIFDNYAVQSKNPSFVKARGRTRTPVIGNAYNKTMAYIQKAEYYDNTALKYRQIEKTLRDTKVKKAIVDKRGENFYKSLIKQLDYFSINRLNQDLTSIEKAMNKVIGNWVKAKIGLNPSVAFKQLASVVNYAENMPTLDWTTGFAKGLTTPKETFDFVWKNSEYIRNRYNNGYSEAVQSAMNGVNNLPKAKGKLDKLGNGMIAFTRMGDIGAIVYGGAPYIKYQIKQGVPLEEAFKNFELATLRSQQSPFSSTRSTLQNNSSPFIKAFMAFSNTPNQYMRKFYEAQAQYVRKEIDLQQLGKVYTIYGIIAPAMYVWMGEAAGALLYGKAIDVKNAMKRMAIMILGSPIQALPFISDMGEAGLRGTMGLRIYDMQIPAVSDALAMVKDITTGDWIEAMKTFAELGTGAPVKTVTKLIKANVEEEETKGRKRTYRK